MTYPERENIDRWFFDFYEGNLTPQQAEALEVFLEDHPDLMMDFMAWGETSYQADETLSTEFDRTHLLLKKEPRFKAAYALYGLSLMLSALIFIKYYTTGFPPGNSPTLSSLNHTKVSKNNSVSGTPNKSVFSEPRHSHIAEQSETSVLTNNLKYEPIKGDKVPLKNPQKYIATALSNSKHPVQPPPAENSLRYLIGESEQHRLGEENSIQRDLGMSEQTLANSTAQDIPAIVLGSASPLPVELKGTAFTNDEDFGETNDKTSLTTRKKFSLNIVKMRIQPLIRKIEKLSTGLTYIPDISYALPELSQTDVMISNTGAISQLRYQQTAVARWMDEGTQQKISNQVTIDGYSRLARSGLALQLNHHYFGNGALSQYDGAFIISPKIALKRTLSLEPAVRIKFGGYRLDANKIASYNNQFIEFQTGEQQLVNFDTSLSIGSQLLYRDLDLGVTLNSTRGYVGLQAENITGHFNDIFSNKENNYQHASLELSGIAGTQFLSQRQRLSFAPFVYSTWKIGKFHSFVGFSASIYGVKVGGSVSHSQQTVQLGYQSKRFGILAQSSLQKQQAHMRFTHQLMLRINSETSKKQRRYITL